MTVSSGWLVFKSATADLTNVGNIANDGTLGFVNAGAQSYARVISGTGSLTKAGAGTLTLNNAATYRSAPAQGVRICSEEGRSGCSFLDGGVPLPG